MSLGRRREASATFAKTWLSLKTDGSKEKDIELVTPTTVSSLDTFNNEPPVDDADLTAEEKQKLPHVSGKLPWAVYSVAVIEMMERLSLQGSTVVLVNFLQQPLPPGSRTGAGHGGQSGALNLGQRGSTGLILFKGFWICSTPLLGAFVAEQYLGRYRTIQYANFIALAGHAVLIIAGLPWVIPHLPGALAAYLIAVLLIGLGFGGFKANISTLIGEQIPDTGLQVTTDKKGRRVIVDPETTRQRVFLYFYSLLNVGSITGQVSMVYAEKYVGFWLSFLIPTITYMFCPLLMWTCKNRYTKTPASGPVLGNAMRLMALAMKGRWSWNPYRTYRNTKAPDFWTRIKPSNMPVRDIKSWMTFDDIWVDEVRRGLKACRVFFWYILYTLVLRQLGTNLISQAATLRLPHGFPNDVLGNINPLTCIILAPIYDRLLNPFLERKGWKFTIRRRITTGFALATIAILYAAVIQQSIYTTSPCGTHASRCTHADDKKISVFVQAPIYVLTANSEILAKVPILGYAYSHAPKDMKSLVMGAFIFTAALSAALGQAFVPLSEDPWLVWMYGVIGGLGVGATVGVWWSMGGDDEGKEEEEGGRVEESGEHIGREEVGTKTG
ncbi:POT family-domain-containing protein [Lophiotrema nucula]|uniref:POT family-domain-containing protein n=1 Tax=Lophiotrema nucula TaxID=690887 RepID=A0A6A5ZU02_9PLEO|nr:POT family-domain-containing protein [Lophiotrema nucula]